MRRLLLTALLLQACNLALPLAPPPASEAGADGPVVDAPRRDVSLADAVVVDASPVDASGTCTSNNKPTVSDPCREAVCQDGTWSVQRVVEGTGCTANNGTGGTCRTELSGTMVCCTGCWDALATTCRWSPDAQHCGADGAVCKGCAQPMECSVLNGCVNGTCDYSNAADSAPCIGAGVPGMCYGGACCTGCWDSTTCVPGNTTMACGSGGGWCTACSAPLPCQQEVCAGGSCIPKLTADGTPCTDPSGNVGQCHSGVCCFGCWDGSACQPGTSNAACGAGGQECDDCTAYYSPHLCAPPSDGGGCVPAP